MEQELARRVFEPFFTTKPAGVGAGLGMALVADFACRAGGDVRFNSWPGVGTTVILRLPEAPSREVTP
jgi:signal transduction histidine kinase